MHEQMTSQVLVLEAFLHHSDLHPIGQRITASTFVTSHFHLEVIQGTSHVTLEGLTKDFE